MKAESKLAAPSDGVLRHRPEAAEVARRTAAGVSEEAACSPVVAVHNPVEAACTPGAAPEAQVCRTAGEPVVAQAACSPVVGEVVEPSEAHRSEPVVAAGLVGPHMMYRNSLPRTWHDH